MIGCGARRQAAFGAHVGAIGEENRGIWGRCTAPLPPGAWPKPQPALIAAIFSLQEGMEPQRGRGLTQPHPQLIHVDTGRSLSSQKGVASQSPASWRPSIGTNGLNFQWAWPELPRPHLPRINGGQRAKPRVGGASNSPAPSNVIQTQASGRSLKWALPEPATPPPTHTQKADGWSFPWAWFDQTPPLPSPHWPPHVTQHNHWSVHFPNHFFSL